MYSSALFTVIVGYIFHQIHNQYRAGGYVLDILGERLAIVAFVPVYDDELEQPGEDKKRRRKWMFDLER